MWIKPVNNYLYFVIISLVLGSLLWVSDRVLAGNLTVKSATTDTVYYVDTTGVRHPFPNRLTYESWFGPDFSGVNILTDADLAAMPLGDNVVIRPGKYLLKVPSSPKVYAVEPGGVLRQFANQSVLEKIYGALWQLRLRDLPEVFFGDYLIGPPINFAHQVPDGQVVSLSLLNNGGDGERSGPISNSFVSKEKEVYYWKNHGVLEPFSDWSAVMANGYNRLDVLTVDLDLFKFKQKINGPVDRIFNLSLPANRSTASCVTDMLRVAVVFVARDQEVASEDLDVLYSVIDNLGVSWQAATRDLSSFQVSAEPAILAYADEFVIADKEISRPVLDLREISQRFYQTEPDTYDFLIVFNDWLVPAQDREQAAYHLVRNDFMGTNRITFDQSRFYGSQGRLKGIINMNKVDQYAVGTDDGLVSLLNLIHHEILHHWGAAVSFVDTGGERSWKLLSEDKNHWSRWVNWVSPLGGWGWIKTLDLSEGRVLFSSQRQELQSGEIIQFPAIDLYLMGLWPARFMPALQYLIPEDPDSVSDEVVGHMQSISIDQIISAHGPQVCQLGS